MSQTDSTPPRSIVLALDRVLPNSAEAEMAVLGAMLQSTEASHLAMERLTEESFYNVAHQMIFSELCALVDAGKTPDLVLLSQSLRDKSKLEEVGGPAYLADLFMKVPSPSMAEHYIDIVMQKAMLRQMIAAGHETVSRAFEEQDEPDSLLASVMQKIQELAEGQIKGGFTAVSDMMKSVMESIEKMMANKGMITGIATGFRDLDRMTGGFHPGEMIVIAARPSMGKTSFAMNVAEHVAIDQGIPVGVFSLEMSKEELVKRMVSSRARVNLKRLADGFAGEQVFSQLTIAAGQLMKSPLYIDDTPGLTITQLRARAHRLKKSKDIQLLVIDYVQLMKCPGRQSDSNRQVEVSLISQGVKALAKELSVPVIAVCQLNRSPDNRSDGKPKISDLRESGQLEQDADVVGLLVRPEMYAEDEESKAAAKGKATLHIGKQRNGPTGDVSLTFLAEYTRFEDAARVEESDQPEPQQNY